MSSSNDAELRTPTRMRLTRNRTANESPSKDIKAEGNQDTPNPDIKDVDNNDVNHDEDLLDEGDEGESPSDRRVSHHHTPHKPLGAGRVDSATTQILRPIFEGIYDLRDAEYAVL